MAKAQSKNKLSQCYGAGAVVAIGALGILGYCVYQFNKNPKEIPVYQTNETKVHKPKDDKFEMK